MENSKNSNPKKRTKLHNFIATGGNPKDFDGANHDWNTTAENGPADKGEEKNPK